MHHPVHGDGFRPVSRHVRAASRGFEHPAMRPDLVPQTVGGPLRLAARTVSFRLPQLFFSDTLKAFSVSRPT